MFSYREGSAMESDIEKMDLFRRRMLMGVLAGLGLWQLPELMSLTYAEFGSAVSLTKYFIPFSVIGGCVYMYYMWKMMRFGRELKKEPKSAEALNNELVVANRSKALKSAYFITLIFITALFLISVFFDISGRLVSQSTIFVMVVSALSAFLIKDRG